MKRQKRDRMQRAQSRGYQAGLSHRSSEYCPYADPNIKEYWLGGWRKARERIAQGYFS